MRGYETVRTIASSLIKMNLTPYRLGVDACRATRPQQGCGGAGEQAGPTAVGDDPRRRVVRRRSCQCRAGRALTPTPPLRRKTTRKLQHDHDHYIWHGPEAGDAGNNSDLQGRLNDGRRFATFMMARTPHCAAFTEKPDTRMQPLRVADGQGRSSRRRAGLVSGVHT